VIPKITEKKRLHLVGVDFFGKPYEKAGGWSAQNAVGELWKRVSRFIEKQKDSIKHLVSESGYELWIDFEEEKASGNKYIFVGLEVARLEDTPLELVAKILPETRYAVFTFTMREIKENWSKTQDIWNKWLPKAGLEPAYDYMIEYYDSERFKGMDNPESELDFMVPVK
jgi:AraC family transcriptional regulator